MGFQRVLDQFVGRRVADGDEHAFGRNLGDLAGFDVFGPHAGDAFGVVIAHDLDQLVIPQRHDLVVFHQPVDQDLFGPQFVAAVDQGYLAGKIGQEQRLFYGRVAAADHDNFHAAIKEAVTGGTGGYAKALEFFLTGQAQPFGPRAGGQNNSIGGVGGAAVAFGGEGAFGDVQIGDDVADDLGAHRGGVFLHFHHQFGALDLGETREVFYLGGGGQLPARLDPLHQNGFQHGTAGVDSGGVSGRAGADDQNFGMACLGHDCPLVKTVVGTDIGAGGRQENPSQHPSRAIDAGIAGLARKLLFCEILLRLNVSAHTIRQNTDRGIRWQIRNWIRLTG